MGVPHLWKASYASKISYDLQTVEPGDQLVMMHPRPFADPTCGRQVFWFLRREAPAAAQERCGVDRRSDVDRRSICRSLKNTMQIHPVIGRGNENFMAIPSIFLRCSSVFMGDFP